MPTKESGRVQAAMMSIAPPPKIWWGLELIYSLSLPTRPFFILNLVNWVMIGEREHWTLLFQPLLWLYSSIMLISTSFQVLDSG